jgi:D-aminoacyl-tRNA deacylase
MEAFMNWGSEVVDLGQQSSPKIRRGHGSKTQMKGLSRHLFHDMSPWEKEGWLFCTMRAAIQRVSKAQVRVRGKEHGAINHGLMVLVGIEDADTPQDAEWLAAKLVKLRIFSDAEGKMNADLTQVGGGMLVVSQFTLHAKTKKGTRPSFIRAAHPDLAIPLYEHFVQSCNQELGKPVATGEFGAAMEVELTNDGPVTIWIDTQNKE